MLVIDMLKTAEINNYNQRLDPAAKRNFAKKEKLTLIATTFR